MMETHILAEVDISDFESDTAFPINSEEEKVVSQRGKAFSISFWNTPARLANEVFALVKSFFVTKPNVVFLNKAIHPYNVYRYDDSLDCVQYIKPEQSSTDAYKKKGPNFDYLLFLEISIQSLTSNVSTMFGRYKISFHIKCSGFIDRKLTPLTITLDAVVKNDREWDTPFDVLKSEIATNKAKIVHLIEAGL